MEENVKVDSYADKMEKDGTWGGQVELFALANKFEFNIVVHQVGDPNIFHTIHEPQGSVPTIHISYHLGRHYNSVRREDDLLVEGVAPISGAYAVGHDIERNREVVQSKRLTDTEMQKIKRDSKKVYNDSFMDSLADSMHDYFGFLIPGD
mmetsp:Transcript_8461/g.14204  ORF Transcript_8461/g.14204 Transcript_8461/m.14204 type:complete len:150 (-) Transcript_8461:206-655(-)